MLTLIFDLLSFDIKHSRLLGFMQESVGYVKDVLRAILWPDLPTNRSPPPKPTGPAFTANVEVSLTNHRGSLHFITQRYFVGALPGTITQLD